jgi:predicted nucleic acid-binding Zn finger protein
MSEAKIAKLLDLVKQRETVDKDLMKFLEIAFSSNPDKIMEALDRGITKYVYKPSNKVLWTAMGREKEYILYPKEFCSCLDFYKEVVINGNRSYCKHLLAQIISKGLQSYQTVELDDYEFKIRLEEMY